METTKGKLDSPGPSYRLLALNLISGVPLLFSGPQELDP